MSKALTAEEMITRSLAKLETLEGRKITFEDSVSIHHGAIASALTVIKQQQERITNLERLALAMDKKSRNS